MPAITPAERKRLAELYELSEQYLYQCLTGRREMDAAAAMKAELGSGGVIKRQMVCQKTFKSIWPDLEPLPELPAANDAHAADPSPAAAVGGT